MIYVCFAHGFEEIEAVTPVDVLRRAGEEVKTVGIGGKTITGSHGITIHCDISHKEMDPEKVKMLVLPGGMPGATNLQKSPEVQQALEVLEEGGKWIAAICAAPMILGEKGMLEGKKATIFPGMEAHLKGAIPLDQPVVVDGKLITANGPGAALPFALQLVEELQGADKAKEIGDAMQWTPTVS